MSVRPFLPGDAAKVQRLLDRSWPDDPVLRALHDLHGPAGEDPWRRTLVIEEEGGVRAAGSVRLGTRHPARYWLVLNVDPDWRGRGLGTRLLDRLSALVAADPRPFRGQARPSDAGTARFLRRHGFHPIVRTWEGVIDPLDPAVHAALDQSRVDNAGYRFVRSGGASRALWPALAAFYENWYHAVHPWDPPARWPLERSLEHFCGPEMVAVSLTCVYEGNRLIGAGSFILPPFDLDRDELYLVQVGVLGVDPMVAVQLTAHLVADLLRYAKAEGKPVRFEIDSAHPALWSVAERLPLVESNQDFAIYVNDDAISSPTCLPGEFPCGGVR